MSSLSRREAGGRLLAGDSGQLLVAGDSERTPVVANTIDSSELWRRMVASDESERMPVDGEPLTPEQLMWIKNWIDAGAPIHVEDLEKSMVSLSVVDKRAAPEHYPRALAIYALAIAIGAEEVFVGGYAEVTRWNFRSGELLGRMPVAWTLVAALAVSADGQHLIVSSGSPGQRGVIELIALSDETNCTALDATSDIAPDIAISPDGERVAIAGHDGTLRVAQLQSTHRLWTDLRVNAARGCDFGNCLVRRRQTLGNGIARSNSKVIRY